jgi:uncharacterized protein involved in type VI secretion and phage assembly
MTTIDSNSVQGVAPARVTDNADPQGLCRVKVAFPWHEDPGAGHWARLVTPMAGKDRGVVAIPEVGDEVLVAFERDDLRFPYVLGGLWNSKDTPPAVNRDGRNDRRIFKSRAGHSLTFDDGADGAVALMLHDGKKIVFDDDGIRVEDGKGNRIVIATDSGAITIEATGHLTIKAASVAVQVATELEISAGSLRLSATAPPS